MSIGQQQPRHQGQETIATTTTTTTTTRVAGKTLCFCCCMGSQKIDLRREVEKMEIVLSGCFKFRSLRHKIS